MDSGSASNVEYSLIERLLFSVPHLIIPTAFLLSVIGERSNFQIGIAAFIFSGIVLHLIHSPIHHAILKKVEHPCGGIVLSSIVSTLSLASILFLGVLAMSSVGLSPWLFDYWPIAALLPLVIGVYSIVLMLMF